jgi:beta-phosphoglucomutase family hydrolase
MESVFRNIRAVIFDLDGTIVDSEPNYFEADKKLFAEYNITNYSQEMKNKYIGIGSRQMMEEIKRDYQLDEMVEVLLNKKNQYYLELARSNTVVYPEMLALLKLLKNNNYPLALASGSSPGAIEFVLSVTGLKDFFGVVLSAEEVKKGKPEPDIFLEAAKQLGISPRKCVVIEDSPYGVEAAKSAGMYCVALPYICGENLQDSFREADLLFSRGIREFSAVKAFAWLTAVNG